MKRLITLCAVALMASSNAFGWGRMGHATIAKIAEDHLSKKAATTISEYLDGKSIVSYASYPDDYRSVHLIDVGFEPSNSPRVTVWGHSFQANKDGSLFHGERKGDEYVKNCVWRLDEVINRFEKEHKSMTDSARRVSLAFIVHLVGDIHCPRHVRYEDEPTSGGYMIKYGGKTMKNHSFWDTSCLTACHPWGYTDIASLLDRCNKREIAEICEGDVYTWAEENARGSRFTIEVKEGETLTRAYVTEHIGYVEDQIRKAGYRLASVLNEICK